MTTDWQTWALIALAVALLFQIARGAWRWRHSLILSELYDRLEERVRELEIDAADELQCDGCGIWYDAEREDCPACGTEEVRDTR